MYAHIKKRNHAIFFELVCEFDVFVVVFQDGYDVVDLIFLHEGYCVVNVTILILQRIRQFRHFVILQLNHKDVRYNWSKRISHDNAVNLLVYFPIE